MSGEIVSDIKAHLDSGGNKQDFTFVAGGSSSLDQISAENSFGIFKNFRQVDGGLKMLRLV